MIGILNNLNVLGLFNTNCDILGEDLTSVLHDIYLAIQIATPILVILLCSVDIVRATAGQNEKDMQHAISNSIKRVIVGVAIFFVPVLIDAVMLLIGIANGTCSLVG